jgi:hypothetical protein
MVNRFRNSGKDRFVIVYVSDHDPEGMDMPAAFKKYGSSPQFVLILRMRAWVRGVTV